MGSPETRKDSRWWVWAVYIGLLFGAMLSLEYVSESHGEEVGGSVGLGFLLAAMVFFIVFSLREGAISTKYSVIERSEAPIRFFGILGFVVLFAVGLILILVGLLPLAA